MNLRQLTLLLIAGSYLSLGAWAQVFPRSYYDDFPAGRQWVSLDGPYNEHLMRDIGGLYLAVGAALVAVAFVGTVLVQRIVAATTVLYAGPHFLYHALHLEPYGTGDRIALLISLALVVVAPLVVAFTPPRKVQSPTTM